LGTSSDVTSAQHDEAAPRVPARILNEHVYCPRLAWLEWEARAFRDNLDTAEGTDAHRRIDVERHERRDDGAVVTSLELSSERLGITARIDRVELRDGVAVPVETKHGRPRRGAVVVWPPELAQIAAQAALLREQGHTVPFAEVYFTESRSRHRVDLPEDVETWLTELVASVRANAAHPAPPPPLVDSPKCPRCSLVGICLPDETNLLDGAVQAPPRRLVPRDDPRQPLYVMSPGALVRKRGARLVLEVNGEEQGSRRLLDVSHLAVYGNATVTAGATRACLEASVPILWFSTGGWFQGYTVANGGSWVARRIAQVSGRSGETALAVACAVVHGKVRNQRTLLRRLGGERVEATLGQLATLAESATAATSLGVLLGIEGAAARAYFGQFPRMLKGDVDEFTLEGRNRRPPKDPVNAMLSFAYALLVRDTTVAALAAGLDPQIGFFHQPRFGRPSLALDLAEELRPLVADSTVIGAVNNGELRDHHFVRRGGGVALTAAGRKQLVRAYERRVAVVLRHPLFGYDVSYRRAMELQARQLAAFIEGQLQQYRPLMTR